MITNKETNEVAIEVLKACEESFIYGERPALLPIGKYGEFESIYGKSELKKALDFLVKNEYILDNFRITKEKTIKINYRKIEIITKGRLYVSDK